MSNRFRLFQSFQEDYTNIDFISIFADNRNELNTLEPQFVNANSSYLKDFCRVLGIDSSIYDTAEKIKDYMISNKTTWALKVFESNQVVQFPEYIKKAVAWCDEK